MSSLHFRGDFIKFAANNHRLLNASGRFYCASTGYIAAPQKYLAVYLLIPFFGTVVLCGAEWAGKSLVCGQARTNAMVLHGIARVYS